VIVVSDIRLANEAWEAMFRAQATIAREFLAADVWEDLQPTDYGVLYALSKAPEGLRISELCDDVLLTQPGMSRLIIRLEGRGLVQRQDDPDDARASRIQLTPAGVETQRRIGSAHAHHVARAMARALDPAQLETLRQLSVALLAGAARDAATTPTPERTSA
jgi:DNA-binding MarR family transcriptional regulator